MIPPNREANPLRPYSVPGAYSAPVPSGSGGGAPSSAPAPTPSLGPSLKPHPAPTSSSFAQQNAAGRYASKARDMLQDLDYDGYLEAASGDGSSGTAAAVRGIRALADELMWKYTSVLMAQPFEVAKAVLQVRCAQEAVEKAAKPAPVQKEPEPENVNVRNRDKERGREHEQDMEESQESVYDLGSSSHVWNAPNGESDSENDELSYFANPTTPSPVTKDRRPRQARRRGSSPFGSEHSRHQSQQSPPNSAGAAVPASKPSVHHLSLKRPDSVLEVMNQLWQKEGPFGVWKGSNATFIYSVLQSLLENWSRSLLSALFNVPDLGVVAEMDRIVEIAAPYPWASLLVAATAAVATGLLLAPLDLVRTRLMLTPSSQPPRRTLTLLRSLPSYLCPGGLFVPTVLHSLVHPLLTLSTPLVLRTQFMIDSQLSPMAFSIAKFCASSASLFIKLPLETILRRGQVSALFDQQRLQQQQQQLQMGSRRSSLAKAPTIEVTPLETVVPVGRYNGVLGTMYHIVSEEGTREIPAAPKPKMPPPKAGQAKNRRPSAKIAETVHLKGQGMEGLWRGWKVSWWGLVGLWASSMVGTGGEGEF